MMKLTASPPITIHAARHAMRWFTAMFRHTDGTLLLYIEYTYDSYYVERAGATPYFGVRMVRVTLEK